MIIYDASASFVTHAEVGHGTNRVLAVHCSGAIRQIRIAPSPAQLPN